MSVFICLPVASICICCLCSWQLHAFNKSYFIYVSVAEATAGSTLDGGNIALAIFILVLLLSVLLGGAYVYVTRWALCTNQAKWLTWLCLNMHQHESTILTDIIRTTKLQYVTCCQSLLRPIFTEPLCQQLLGAARPFNQSHNFSNFCLISKFWNIFIHCNFIIMSTWSSGQVVAQRSRSLSQSTNWCRDMVFVFCTLQMIKDRTCLYLCCQPYNSAQALEVLSNCTVETHSYQAMLFFHKSCVLQFGWLNIFAFSHTLSIRCRYNSNLRLPLIYPHPYRQITVETEFDNPLYETGGVSVQCILKNCQCLQSNDLQWQGHIANAASSVFSLIDSRTLVNMKYQYEDPHKRHFWTKNNRPILTLHPLLPSSPPRRRRCKYK